MSGASSITNSTSLSRGRLDNFLGNTSGYSLATRILYTSIGSTSPLIMYARNPRHPLSKHLLALITDMSLVRTSLLSPWNTKSMLSFDLNLMHLSRQSIEA